ncbi:MAG TPA: ABC transporter permease [Gemmatimonadaceae bacterium]
MRFTDVVLSALGQIRANKLRSFFTLLGVIVSVTFLVAVVAIIQGLNSYVKENVAGAIIGANSFQVRRTPINFARFSDDEWRRAQRRPKIGPEDAAVIMAALPDAEAISLQSGWPTPQADITWGNRSLGDALILGVTPAYQTVQDYRVASGRPLTELDLAERRAVVVIGSQIAENLFENVEPVGRHIRILGEQFEIVGVNARKGRVLGQSFDGFVLMPINRFEMLYGRRNTTTVSVKMANAADVAPAMQRAEEAMRIGRHLRPSEENNFSIETSDALVEFWNNLTRVLFAVLPAVVGIGIVVGGIVIMNIMLMSVSERTHEIGIRRAVGARSADIERQFLAESIVLAVMGGLLGVLWGWALASLVATISPLPARVTSWSIGLALTLGAGVGIIFGVYPARRAARLDPVASLRAD